MGNEHIYRSHSCFVFNECHVIGTESALIGGKNEHLPLVTLN